MKLIIEPSDGVEPLLTAIRNAKKSVEIAIFRFDRKDVEIALKAAALAKGVRVTALIASANRGGETRLRSLELRFLEAGIIVARTNTDLVRYHDKFVLIDRRTLYLLSFNFTHLDIDHSRGFGVVTTNAAWTREAVRLFRADCARTTYAPKSETFVVSPSNSRKVLGDFLRRAKTQLLIYDPKIGDKEMLRILNERAKAGVEIKIIGSVTGRHAFDAQKLRSRRLHTRTIIRDRRQAFVGSQSLRPAELDARRELGLIVQDAKVVRKLIDTFEADWTPADVKDAPVSKRSKGTAKGAAVASKKEEEKVAEKVAEQKAEHEVDRAEKAVQVLTKELDPLATTVKKAVRKAVAKAGEDVLHDEGVKDTMKKVVKRAVKEAVKEATQQAHDDKAPG
ncbi:MAG: hypothetical protein B7X11_02610 [Acidobacteria bacterium 37-65-4]|nr:MAG: hypothetical protein B7X11_02610 [Acidobacteria bacterium 37-65-4]